MFTGALVRGASVAGRPWCVGPVVARAAGGSVSRPVALVAFAVGVRGMSDELRVPSSAEAKQLPRRFCELSNETLSIMSVQGVHGAHKERLLREIMRVDSVTWEEAHKMLQRMNTANDQHKWIVTLPYKVGIGAGAVFGVGSIPLVFHKNTAIWFNNSFVHEDLPDGGVEALDTVYKVGAWTWGWMEPILGTASFVLLAMQLMRAQMLNMDLQPYGALVASWRANRLARKFPQYNRSIVRDFARSDPWER